jgi:hypothetical protein
VGKSSGSNSTTSTSGPPQQFLDAYQNVLGRAQGVANTPLQQYPTGPNASNVVAGFQPLQQQGFSDTSNYAFAAQPWIQDAGNYIRNAATPISPLQFNGVQNLPAAGLAGFYGAQQTAAGLPGSVQPYTTAATSPIDLPGYDTLSTYFNPYQSAVTQATQNAFNQQNAQQFNQIRGNSASSGAFGGDREAIAEATTAGQQAMAQDPILAQIQQQGFAQAQGELNTQQQLALARQQAERQYALGAGQLTEGAALAGGQLGLSAGQGLLGEFNTQQQTGVGAQEATGWLNQGAGYGLANLGQEMQNLGLSGSSALLNAGGLQQQQLQQQLNVPYEQFIQQQAYPFQTTGWLANIAEGLGGASGGRSTTTYPGPSTFGQVAGAGLAGVGLLGQTGAFGSNGWLTGGGGGGGFNGAGFDPASAGGDFGGGGDFFAASGGRIEPRRRAMGGGLAAVPSEFRGNMAPHGVPDLSGSIVPGASGLGAQPASPGGGALAKSFMQPVTSTTTTSSGGGGGILGALGTVVGLATGTPFLGAIGSVADKVTGVNRGGGIGFDDGGSVRPTTPLQIPDLSKSYIPASQAPARTMGPPAPPTVPHQQDNPIADATRVVQGLDKVFTHDTPGKAESLGGAVMPSDVPLQYDGGGSVPYQATAGGMAGATGPLQQRAMTQQYADMPAEKLQELAMRYPATTPQGAAIARALQLRRMNPTSGYPGGPSPAGPYGASGEAQAGTTAARGGRMGYDSGGDIADPSTAPSGAEEFEPVKNPDRVEFPDIGLGKPPGNYAEPAPSARPRHMDVPWKPTNIGARVADVWREGTEGIPPEPTTLPQHSRDVPFTPAPSSGDGLSASPESMFPADSEVPPAAALTPSSTAPAGAAEFEPAQMGLAAPTAVAAPSGIGAKPATRTDIARLHSRFGDDIPTTILRDGMLAPGVAVNSKGEPYSTTLTTMTPEERRNEAASAAALRSGTFWGSSTPSGVPQVTSTPGGTNGIVPPGAPDSVVAPAGPVTLSPNYGRPLSQPQLSVRDDAIKFWMAQGAPQHVAEGIADRIGAESSFRPAAWNPDDKGSPSGGLYQHHADRLDRLKEFAAKQGLPWTDAGVQNRFSLTEVQGGDPIAARHWQEILNAPDRPTAATLWNKYFERGVGGGGVAGGVGSGRGLGAPDQLLRPGEQPGGGQGLAATPASAGAGSRERPDLDHSRTDWFHSPWMPLIAAGAGMLASRSPYPGVALGEGLQTGIKVAGQQSDRETKAQLSEVRAQRVEDQAKHMSDMADRAMKETERKSAADVGRLQQGEVNLDLKKQLADAATLRAQTQLASASSDAEHKRIQDQLRKDLNDITAGKGKWEQGVGPDPNDPTKQTQGMWHMPTSGEQPTFHPGVVTQRPATGEAAILHDLVQSGAAKDTADAIRIHADLKRDPNSHPQAIQKMLGTEVNGIRNSMAGMSMSPAQVEAQARANIERRVKESTTIAPAPAAARPAPAAPAQTPAAAPAAPQQPSEVIQNGWRYRLNNGTYTPVAPVQ